MRQIHHISPRDARDPDLTRRQGGHTHHLATEFQESAQAMEDGGNPRFATPTRFHLAPQG
jgi:hypothetical protein